jgi:hypothetical protein
MLKPAAFFSSVFLVIGMLEIKVEELIWTALKTWRTTWIIHPSPFKNDWNPKPLRFLLAKKWKKPPFLPLQPKNGNMLFSISFETYDPSNSINKS